MANLDSAPAGLHNSRMTLRPASPSAAPALAGRTAWIISDGKAGHEAQCLGVAAALGLNAVIKRVTPSGLYKAVAPWGPVARRERIGAAGSPFAPPWPAVALATGRTTIPYIRALKRKAGPATFTVILLDPRTAANSADLIWVPEHDRRRGVNVMSTLTSPHVYSRARLDALRADLPEAIAALPQPRVAVLIGGPNRDYRYGPDDAQRLAAAVGAMARSGASLMITPSRRTPPELLDAVMRAAVDAPRVVFTGEGANPYSHFLAAADAFLVTADSVNMACEAAATGRPIYVFRPAGASAKFDRFHAALEAYGASRLLPEGSAPFESWSYAPLDSASAIADEILTRWRRRVEMLPGLVGPAPEGA
ncbi:MAG: mitochondrial fission ELM1 family protein [Hyphomicrobium sp.]